MSWLIRNRQGVRHHHSPVDPSLRDQCDRITKEQVSNVRFWLGAEVRAPAWRLPLSGGKQTFDLNVLFSADYVRFGPKSGRIDTVTVESARDPKRTFKLNAETETAARRTAALWRLSKNCQAVPAFLRRLVIKPSPARPMPKRARLAGSGISGVSP